MDLTRVALIGTIVVVSYYLLLQFSGLETALESKNSTEEKAIQYNPSNDSKRSLSELPVSPQSAPLEPLSADPVEQSPGSFWLAGNDLVDLVIDKESGAIVRAQLKQIFTELGGDESVKILGYEGQDSYYANSGFYNSSGFISPKFYEQKIVETEDGQTQFIYLGESNNYLLKKIITSKRGKYFFEIEDFISAKSPGAEGVSSYSRITRFGGIVPSDRFNYSHQGPVFSTEQEKFQKFDFDDLNEEIFLEESSAGWFGVLQPYFMSAWVPDQTKRHTYQGKEARKGATAQRGVVLTAAGQKTALNGGFFTNKSTFFVGPRLTNQLKEVQEDLRLVVDYGFLWWIAQPMYLVMEWFHGFFNNWGMAIIFLTLVTKAILWPLTANQYRSMGDMRRIAPQMQAVQAKYPNPEDRTKMSQEMMALYKKEGVNPLSSCLPLLLQMPFFIAVYWVLMESVELRHAPFYGWIVDLTARDPYFVLAIINGLLMWYTQKLTPTPPSNDPVQANMMKFMPVIFALLFAFFPAGFVLYFTVNTAVTIIQQLWYTSSPSKSK